LPNDNDDEDEDDDLEESYLNTTQRKGPTPMKPSQTVDSYTPH